MAKQVTSRVALALRARGPARRSALYKWLLAHYGDLAPVLNVDSPDWITASTEVAAEGMVGANGKPASSKALRQIWLRVTRDVHVAQAQDEARAAQRPRAQRSRSDAAWQPSQAVASRPAPAYRHEPDEPEEVIPPRRPTSLPPSQAPPKPPTQVEVATSPNRGDAVELTPHAKAELEKLQQMFSETDRKRFGAL
jgi:hypothetical protein